jgi:hypothetical protein
MSRLAASHAARNRCILLSFAFHLFQQGFLAQEACQGVLSVLKRQVVSHRKGDGDGAQFVEECLHAYPTGMCIVKEIIDRGHGFAFTVKRRRSST